MRRSNQPQVFYQSQLTTMDPLANPLLAQHQVAFPVAQPRRFQNEKSRAKYISKMVQFMNYINK
jgi:hypothetical protein